MGNHAVRSWLACGNGEKKQAIPGEIVMSKNLANTLNFRWKSGKVRGQQDHGMKLGEYRATLGVYRAI